LPPGRRRAYDAFRFRSASARVPHAGRRDVYLFAFAGWESTDIMKRTPVTDLAALPVILTLPEIAAVYRLSPLTIRRGLQQNTFRPLPFDKYPYRWLRDDVQRDLQTHRAKLKTRRHGFAAAKAKRLLTEDRLATK